MGFLYRESLNFHSDSALHVVIVQKFKSIFLFLSNLNFRFGEMLLNFSHIQSLYLFI
jgi:hypothetical protein